MEHWGQSLTLVNWCTMMCKQCRFMSSACVLSAASRICNSRNHEVLPHLTQGKVWPKGTEALPVAHSARLHSSPGSVCSMPAAGCCRSHSSRGLQTGSWVQVKELPSRRTCSPTSTYSATSLVLLGRQLPELQTPEARAPDRASASLLSELALNQSQRPCSRSRAT